MKKRILLLVFIVLTTMLSVNAISANDENVTDLYSANQENDSSVISLSTENDLSVSDNGADENAVLESDNSNNLSNNTLGESLENEILEGSSKVNTTLESSSGNIYYGSNYEVTLKDSNGTGITNQKVIIKIGSKIYEAKTNSKGLASVKVELNPGSYATSVSFEGNDSYNLANILGTVKIFPTITSKDISKYYKGSAKYTATFFTTQGKALVNTNVQIKINGKSYTVKTNNKGVASLDINLKPGNYLAYAYDPITGYSLKNNVRVLSTISASDISKIYTDGKKFSAKFLKSNGKVLSKKYIKFKVNGKTYKVKTNANGVASLSLTNLKKGTYKIISYNADGLTKTNTVKVIRKSSSSLKTGSYVYLTGDTKRLKVTLLNQFGYAPGSGKIIKVSVNGKTYTGTTNSNGVATIKLAKLSKGSYTVNYKFAGNSFYGKSSASNKLIVLPSKISKLTVKSTTNFGHGANTQFKVALSASNIALDKKTVTLKVNGKTFTKTTDKNGIVSLPIDLAIGKYTIYYSFKGESKINSVSGSTGITVKERSPTYITWKSGTNFYQGLQSYKVLLLDSNKKAVSNQVIKLIINSKTYTATTASNGHATFSVNVAPGNYSVIYNYGGNNDNAPSSNTTKISVEKKNSTGYGYWLFGSDMKKVNLDTLASKGTTDIFLNYYAFNPKCHGESNVLNWIKSANNKGIKVHIWMQTFYENGKWINPVKNGAPYTSYFNKKINEAVKYASMKGVAGVHFDYLRYPGNAYKTTGGTAAINTFIKQAVTAIHKANPNCLVSATLMPETSSSAKYYGQDYSVISNYMDIVIPMVYKGNYGKTTSWITTTSKWYVDNSKGAKVWIGIQSYHSDNNPTKLSSSALASDSQAALDSTANGVIVFRWGLSNLVNFNDLSDKTSSPSYTGSFTIRDIITSAISLKSYVESNGKLPNTVSVKGESYLTPQFLYLMSKALESISNSNLNIEVLPIAVGDASSSGSFKESDLNKKDYLDLNNKIISFIKSNFRAPNYANSPLGDIPYNSLVYSYAKILSFYNTNNRLPESVFVNATFKANAPINPKYTNVNLKNILKGAKSLSDYYKTYGKLPSTVTISEGKYSTAEFLYLMSKAIVQLGSGNTKAITAISVGDPNSPSGDTFNSEQLSKANLIKLANSVVSYIDSNKNAPNYASASIGKIIYDELVDSFARTLTFYGNNNRLPNYVEITYKAPTNNYPNSISALAKKLTNGLTSQKAKAKALFVYVRDKISYSFYYNTVKGASGTLTSGSGNCCDQAQLLVALARSAGLTARFATGYCTFTSGKTYGHVWVQIKVDGTWHALDTTSSRNTYDKINNWNTKSYTSRGVYNILPY